MADTICVRVLGFDPRRFHAREIGLGSSGRHWLTCAAVNAPTIAMSAVRGHLQDPQQVVVMLMRCEGAPGFDVLEGEGGNVVVMSDSIVEVQESRWVWEHARGRVLINGLGLGLTVQMALEHRDVEHVDVVEIEAEVIELVGPYVTDPRVKIHHADAYRARWPKGTRWDVAWHDIWDLPDSAEARAGMARLEAKYAASAAVQSSWPRHVQRLEEAGVVGLVEEWVRAHGSLPEPTCWDDE